VSTPTEAPTNYFRATVGIIFLLGSFGIFYLVLGGKADINWKDVSLMVVGALIAKLGTIIDWTFGSSQSSDHKTDIMAETAKSDAEALGKKPIDQTDGHLLV